MRKKQGTYPDIWLSGPDPHNHKLYTACQRSRAQAWFRGEEWWITEQEYIDLWRQDDRYLQKGRDRDSLCMTKRDPDLAWTIDNVEIITRLQHLKNCGRMRTGTTRKTSKIKKDTANATR
jgi:hypothetical protein